jgi:hypothetical protein
MKKKGLSQEATAHVVSQEFPLDHHHHCQDQVLTTMTTLYLLHLKLQVHCQQQIDPSVVAAMKAHLHLAFLSLPWRVADLLVSLILLLLLLLLLQQNAKDDDLHSSVPNCCYEERRVRQ